ncbi:unnamed protein product [Orchesella dallaii]|uniref:Uncharacterized protein n=1 Tax=Orchesella dallaii TaxID=48710 RepID=A0ABP1RWS5_9HEXA
MGDEYLSQAGLYLHEYTRGLRLLHPDHHSITYDVIRQCDQYLKDAYDFDDVGRIILERFELIRARLEQERMEVIGKRNRLQMEATERNAARLALKALIQAKKDHLERLTQYYESLRDLTTGGDD